MKIVKIWRLLLIVICGLTIIQYSCTKDLGNYDYKQLNELVEIKNLPAEINATYGKLLQFSPEIVFSGDPSFDASKYTYKWSYIGPNGLGGSKIFVFNETKDLNLVLTSIVAGTYSAFLGITDKESGVEYRKPFKLKVVNEYNEGWIMMNEANGKARVDMLSLNPDGQFILVKDLLNEIGSGLQLEGKPEMAYTYATGLLIGPDQISYGLYLGTDKGTTKVEPNTFKWTPTMALSYEMFGEIPAGFYANTIQTSGANSAYMIGDGNAYYYSRALNIYFSAPINYINEEQKSFEVAPFIVGRYGVYYDKTNRRFVKHTGSAATSTVIPDPPQDQRLFSFKTGMELAYMKFVSFNGGEVFSILKAPNSNKKYLARFNPANNSQTYYSEILHSEIENAEFYEVSPEFGYLFYTVGGKIFEYDMVYKTAKLVLDLGSKRVSFLDFYDFKSPSKYKNGNKLMVGYYDPNINDGTEGSLGIYTVPGLNADLIHDNTYSGFGRIKDLTYRER